jgi:hypothetical protein
MSSLVTPKTKAEAEAKYNFCRITEEQLQEALDDVKCLMVLDEEECHTDPGRQEAKLVIAGFMFKAAFVLKKNEEDLDA